MYTKYYFRNFEKIIDGATSSVTTIDYLESPMGVIAMDVTENGTRTRYAVYKDYLGSPLALADKDGNLVYRQFFDAWGRRMNPDDFTYTNLPSVPSWLRGYTGHEHLPEFDLINMNGRLYDPKLGRMLAPDNYVQNIENPQNHNRYSYVMNNPLKFTDPNGELALHWLVGFVDGFFSTGSGRWSAGWKEANKRADNDARLTTGLLQTSDYKPNGEKRKWYSPGRAWQLISRFTWEAPQTTVGFVFNKAANLVGGVEEVEFFHGATYSVMPSLGGSAVSLGSYISASPVSMDPQQHIEATTRGYITMHEYGHYLQSQEYGPLYLFKVGLPSALGNGSWTEHDANQRASKYFQGSANFTWTSTPGLYRYLPGNSTRARWFEYPLFFLGGPLGIAAISYENWNSSW